MDGTNFTNTNGWPGEDHYMTARDLAVLAQNMIKNFPEYYPMYLQKEFTYNGVRQTNRNPILYSMRDADGLKTGHTEAGGYGLTASAKRDGRRLVLVINGLQSNRARARESERLLNYGFRNFSIYPLFKAGQEVDEANVWLGNQDRIPLVMENDLTLSLNKQTRRKMKVKVIYEGPIPAPIQKGQPVATLHITGPGMDEQTYPLVAGKDVEKLGGLSRLRAAFNYLLVGSSSSE